MLPAAKGLQEDVLDEILRLVSVAAKANPKSIQTGTVLFEQPADGRFGGFLHGSILERITTRRKVVL